MDISIPSCASISYELRNLSAGTHEWVPLFSSPARQVALSDHSMMSPWTDTLRDSGSQYSAFVEMRDDFHV